MANEIQARKANSLPIHPIREIADLTSKFSNRIERVGSRWEIADNLAPSAAENALLHQRHLDVGGLLHPATDDKIKILVVAMFYGFPNLKIPEDEAKRTAAVYVSQLREFPEWAVKKACEQILQDKVSGRSPDFAPSIATLVGLCRGFVRDLQEERAKLAAIMQADVYHAPSDDERAAVKAKFEALVSDLKLRAPFMRSAPDTGPLDPVEVERRLIDERDARPMPPLSPALAAFMGIRGAAE